MYKLQINNADQKPFNMFGAKNVVASNALKQQK